MRINFWLCDFWIYWTAAVIPHALTPLWLMGSEIMEEGGWSNFHAFARISREFSQL